MDCFADMCCRNPDICSFESDVFSCVRLTNSNAGEQEINLLLRDICARMAEYEENSIRSYIEYTRNMSVEKFRRHEICESVYLRACSSVVKLRDTLRRQGYADNELYAKLCMFTDKSADKEIISLRSREKDMIHRYNSILSQKSISFGGRHYTHAGMGRFFTDNERSVRRGAFYAYSEFFRANEEMLDEIFGELVSVRTEIALRSGYENYTLYARSKRVEDYSGGDICSLRKSVLRYVVPLRDDLYEFRSRSGGMDRIRFFDEEYYPGLKKYVMSAEDVFDGCAGMFLSDDTFHSVFSDMLKEGLFDVYPREDKMHGSYCAYLPVKKLPFVFLSMDDSLRDAEVLLHEASHAAGMGLSGGNIGNRTNGEFQAYAAEFLMCMKNSGNELADSLYRYLLADKTALLPYAVMCDEFEEKIYNRPYCGRNARKELYAELEERYMYAGRYEDCDVLSRGTYWYRQQHIFSEPFYFADYAAALAGALQIHCIACENITQASDMYRLFCLNSHMPFTGAVKAAGLSDVFDENTINKVIIPVKKELEISF